MIMGGSFTSTGNEASVFARFHFRPHFHQHAGFRLVAPLEREEAESFITSCTGGLGSRSFSALDPSAFDAAYKGPCSSTAKQHGGVLRVTPTFAIQQTKCNGKSKVVMPPYEYHRADRSWLIFVAP